ncbi:MAG: hypothetical protein ACPG5T_10050 [Endozoicomonas sp.]
MTVRSGLNYYTLGDPYHDGQPSSETGSGEVFEQLIENVVTMPHACPLLIAK